jgi:hypothetical protein
VAFVGNGFGPMDLTRAERVEKNSGSAILGIALLHPPGALGRDAPPIA